MSEHKKGTVMLDEIRAVDAAEKYQIPLATLTAFIARNALMDPIGGEREGELWVQVDSRLERLAARLAAGRASASNGERRDGVR